jgi:hypothetical protein
MLEHRVLALLVKRLCCVEPDRAAPDQVRVGFGLDGAGEFGERCRDATARMSIDTEFVVPSTHVLHERMAAHDHASGVVAFQASHRTEPRLESAVIALDAIVRILLRVVERDGHELIDHSP